MALLPSMHVRADDDDDESTTTSVTSTIESWTGVGDFILKVDPPQHTVHLNEKSKNATYAVRVMALPGFSGEVELDIKGLPEESEAVFSREEGVPNPVFQSVLRVEVGHSTAPGQYLLTIIATSEGDGEHHEGDEHHEADSQIQAYDLGEEEDGGISHEATVILIVQGEPSTTDGHFEKRLQVRVATNADYVKGPNVDIFGKVYLRHGDSISGAMVSIEVLDPSGQSMHVASTNSSNAGHFSHVFTLPLNATEGLYTVYVTASFAPYKDATGKTTFTVGGSDAPSILITSINVTKTDGTIPSEFLAGETVAVWVTVRNTGADLENGMIWVEIIDSNGVPISVVVVIVTIHHGEQVKTGLQVVLGSSSPTGIYTVNSLVSNGEISKGGKFLDTEETSFAVTNTQSSQTTTTQTTTEETTQTATTETTETTTTSESTTETTTTETT